MSLSSTQLLKTPATHSFSVFSAADWFWAWGSDTISTYSSSFVEQNVLRVLKNIRIGMLTIITPNETFNFGDAQASSRSAVLRVKSSAFWTRIAFFTDLGLAESFMYGEVECEDMSGLLKLLIENRERIAAVDTLASKILANGRKLTAYKFLGTLGNSRANISAHYDLSNVMFQAFLSDDMNYSSAIFKDFNEDLGTPDGNLESLEDAQLRKMRMILEKADIQPGDRILEIGTGWGSLAMLAATTYDCTIDTVTLSVNQYAHALKRVRAAGLSKRINIHNMDFRECLLKDDWKGAFDKFISVEMIENVGKEFITEYWRVVDWALKPTTGVGVVQVISMPEARIPAYDRDSDFIQKWVSCYIPSLLFLLETMNKGSSGRFTADSVMNIGPHYARTLRAWKHKFLANWDTIISKELVDLYGLSSDAQEIFKRKWIYYFDYCEAGFATRALGDHIIKFTRPENAEFGCDCKASDY